MRSGLRDLQRARISRGVRRCGWSCAKVQPEDRENEENDSHGGRNGAKISSIVSSAIPLAHPADVAENRAFTYYRTPVYNPYSGAQNEFNYEKPFPGCF